MGLKSVIATAVQSGFTALGASANDGLQVSVTYSRITDTGTYNPSTGAKSSPTKTDSVFDSLFYDFELTEVDGDKIKVGDQKIIFPSSRIAFTPSATDYVTISSVKWSITNYFQDPAEATWIIQLRK
jgi:hypothetical protein